MRTIHASHQPRQLTRTFVARGAFFALVAILLPAGICRSQEPVASAARTLPEITARADSLYFAFHPADALALEEGAFASGVDDAGLRWRAARAAIALGMLRPDDAERRALYDGAILNARRAFELAPDDRETWYWLAAATGRRAHRDDPLYSARLGREVYERATALLAVDSAHAGAHHALGQLNAEVLRVSPWIRFVAGKVLRVNIMKYASVAEADRHLRRAVELEPEMIQYVTDLGDWFVRTRNVGELQTLMARLEAIPPRHPMDDRIRTASVTRWRAFVARTSGG